MLAWPQFSLYTHNYTSKCRKIHAGGRRVLMESITLGTHIWLTDLLSTGRAKFSLIHSSCKLKREISGKQLGAPFSNLRPRSQFLLHKHKNYIYAFGRSISLWPSRWWLDQRIGHTKKLLWEVWSPLKQPSPVCSVSFFSVLSQVALVNHHGNGHWHTNTDLFVCVCVCLYVCMCVSLNPKGRDCCSRSFILNCI